MPARAIGSGTVSFGLVSIPVKIYTTNKTSANVSFNMVHAECGSRLKQQYICPKHDEIVERGNMAKGYEFAKGQFVMFSDEEIKALEAVASNEIQLTEFVPAVTVDPVYFEKSYYLGPDKGGDRAYHLLGEAMRETGLVGMAKYAARGKQYLVLVCPHESGGLVMHQLRYSEEIRSFDEVPLGDAPDIADAELELAVQIIEQISSDAFRPEQYTNEVRARILELIDQKVAGQEITAAPEAPQGQIIDLMEALKASLGQGGKAGQPAEADTATSKTKGSKKKTSKKTASADAEPKKKRAAKAK